MRIRPTMRGLRAGITLTEILISIMIMGVGMLALATLFPLGLDQLRKAARSSRSAMLIETATSEISSRDLLYPASFRVNNYGYPFDPFTEDPASAGEVGNIAAGIDRVPLPGSSYYQAAFPLPGNAPTKLAGGTGLPVCYDPLWWFEINKASGNTILPSLAANSEFRFGSGIGIIRQEGSTTPSAYGLQRITNFPLDPTVARLDLRDPGSLFASPDDPSMQTDGARYTVLLPDGTVRPGNGGASAVVPDLSNASLNREYNYTWMFTGKQTDVTNGTIFDGDLVIFDRRPFAVAQVAGRNTALGETVVEAIWGYDSNPERDNQGNALAYGRNKRTVLLRWSASQPDPDVRTGGWIADVTYERSSAAEVQLFYSAGARGSYAAQRCYWYRIAKKADVTTDTVYTGYRQMVVTLTSDVRAKTKFLPTAAGSPPVVNAALICPSVVNVVSRVFYTR